MFRPSKYKTILCAKYAKGFCPYGKDCNYAHGTKDQRSKYHPYPEYFEDRVANNDLLLRRLKELEEENQALRESFLKLEKAWGDSILERKELYRLILSRKTKEKLGGKKDDQLAEEDFQGQPGDPC